MPASKFDLCQWTVRNPHATADLHIPVIVITNTPDAEIEANIRTNAAKDLRWLAATDAHDGIAVMVGGGASVAGELDTIRDLVAQGAAVFAMNNASRYLRGHGIAVDWQVTCDAKPETATLIDPGARGHLLSSQCNPATIAAAAAPVLWHRAIKDVETLFPPEKVKRGGYVLLGGEASTGLGALCCAYALGFRRLEIFGYDSSHRDGESHAYRQTMNDGIPVMQVEWAKRKFSASITMRTQAERFPILAQALQQSGATIAVHGDGLLQHMWLTPPEMLSERDKYLKLWLRDDYRAMSPGEINAQTFLAHMAVDGVGPVIDFGCGTGRGALALAAAGLEVVLVDFVSFCRDQEAVHLPFLEWDLTVPCPLRAPYGYCCDVMEHIPPEHVDAVISNIMASTETVFFQIATVPDAFGKMIGQTLHLTVEPAEWWADTFERLGYRVQRLADNASNVQLIVTRT